MKNIDTLKGPWGPPQRSNEHAMENCCVLPQKLKNFKSHQSPQQLWEIPGQPLLYSNTSQLVRLELRPSC